MSTCFGILDTSQCWNVRIFRFSSIASLVQTIFRIRMYRTCSTCPLLIGTERSEEDSRSEFLLCVRISFWRQDGPEVWLHRQPTCVYTTLSRETKLSATRLESTKRAQRSAKELLPAEPGTVEGSLRLQGVKDLRL